MLDKAQISDEEVNHITKEVIETTIGSEPYKHSDVPVWSETIVEKVVQQLVSQNSAFKYIVNCAIVQKNGAGLNTATRSYWDSLQDREFTIRWENKHLHCLVYVFILPIWDAGKQLTVIAQLSVHIIVTKSLFIY